MKPDISEFSYGYALTENIVLNNAFSLKAAPLFPSLFQEGQQGGGYDVRLPFDGAPMFLQFKLSDCMVRGNAKEATKLGLPYYRMHIRSTRHSDQHPMLLDLENSGELVYYVSPLFHKPDELNDAYLHRHVIQRSIWVKPSEIGELVDGDEHYLAFNHDHDPQFCSKPRIINKELTSSENFYRDTLRHIVESKSKTQDRQSIQKLADEMIGILRRSKEKGFWEKIDPEQLAGIRSPIQQVSYIARTFFGCEVLVVNYL